MLWERSVVEQRYDAVMEVVRDGLPVSLVAGRYGVAGSGSKRCRGHGLTA